MPFEPVAAVAAGMYNFWDKETKQRVWRPQAKANTSITATAFNRNGTMFLYAVGYDWSKVRLGALAPTTCAGAAARRVASHDLGRVVACPSGGFQGVEGHNASFRTAIMLKPVTEEQVKAKKK